MEDQLEKLFPLQRNGVNRYIFWGRAANTSKMINLSLQINRERERERKIEKHV